MRETEFMTMVRSREWKLVHFLGESFGQFFDLRQDPEERHDLWNEPSASEAKQQLLGELREWRIRSQYHTRDWGHDWR